MARPTKEPPSRSSIVPAVARLAVACDLDVEALAWRFALPPDVARLDEVAAGASVPDEMLEAVGRLLAEDDVALRLASGLASRRETLVALVVRASATPGDALHALARWTPLLQEDLEASVERAGAEVRWILRTPRRPRGAGRFVHELALARVIHHLPPAPAPALLPLRAWFAHARPANLAPLAAFLGTVDLTFGAEDTGLAFDAQALERPMPDADARTVDAVAPLLDAELASRVHGMGLAPRVAERIASTLPAGTDVADVAGALHMSPRTLQRRLEQEGTRYTDVLDRARRQLAERILADPSVSLADAAFRLGFSDLATFSRAFKRWTGKPPGQWRRS